MPALVHSPMMLRLALLLTLLPTIALSDVTGPARNAGYLRSFVNGEF